MALPNCEIPLEKLAARRHFHKKTRSYAEHLYSYNIHSQESSDAAKCSTGILPVGLRTRCPHHIFILSYAMCLLKKHRLRRLRRFLPEVRFVKFVSFVAFFSTVNLLHSPYRLRLHDFSNAKYIDQRIIKPITFGGESFNS